MQPAELFLFLTSLSQRIGQRMGPLMQNHSIYLTQADKPTGELPRWGWHRQALDRIDPSRSRRCWQSRLGWTRNRLDLCIMRATCGARSCMVEEMRGADEGFQGHRRRPWPFCAEGLVTSDSTMFLAEFFRPLKWVYGDCL